MPAPQPRPGDPRPPSQGEATLSLPPADPGSTAGPLPTLSLPPGHGREGAAPAPGPQQVPGYQIEKELGRGGMGVVYQAVDMRLKRRVALKMILAGGHAGEAELGRFKTEAEAIARLQHPHIVQIHEIGEHNGLPYFAIEYCPGGSLSSKLGGTPLPPRQAAALVEKLAVATQAAHDKGVIHRDLKPANVLLAEDGTAKVTDFGLAKKLDEAGQTHTGAVMGTPSYMAPEQASGSREVGPACDVYALGAILYECLTGRPPYKAATLMDTLRQVVHDEPVPPTQLQSRTPRDLETICLKCLQKEPGKRYPSAAALAEDLGRFQRGEPISARPVGRPERLWRWCRRNPGLAGALAAVLLTFAAGTAISAALAVQADRRAGEAEQERDNARQSEERATQSAAAEKTARLQLQRSNDRLLTTTARGLLRPLSAQGQQESIVALSGQEVAALWELASADEEELRLRFMQEALADRDSIRQLRGRAPFALHAAVGLDARRRARVERLLGDRLAAREMPVELREQGLLVLAELGPEDPVLAGRAAAALVEIMTRADSSAALESLTRLLAAMTARMEPTEALALLAQGMSQRKSLLARGLFAQSCAEVAARMEPGKAVAALEQLLSKADPFDNSGQYLGEGLAAAAARLPAHEGAALLTRALNEHSRLVSGPPLARGLAAVAVRLPAHEGAALLGQAMTGYRKDPLLLRYLAGGLSTVADGLPAQQGRQVRRQAAAILVEALGEKGLGSNAWESLAQGLAAVSSDLEPETARQAAELLVQAIGQSQRSSYYGAGGLAEGLAAVLAPLEVRDRQQPAARAAEPLFQAVSEGFRSPDSRQDLLRLENGLSAILASLEPGPAEQAAAALTRILSKTTNPSPLPLLARSLALLARRMEPRKAAAVLTGAMNAPGTAAPVQLVLAEGLAAVAERMPAKDAVATLLEAVGQDMGTGEDGGPGSPPHPAVVLRTGAALPVLVEGLAAAARRDPAQGRRVIGQVAGRLLAAMKEQQARLPQGMFQIPNSAETFRFHQLARALAVLAGRPECQEAVRQAAGLVGDTLGRGLKSPDSLPSLAQDLSALAARLEPAPRQKLVRPLVAALTRAMAEQAHNTYALQQLVAAVSTLAPHLEPAEAVPVLLDILSRHRDNPFLQAAPAEGLAALAARLEPEAAQAALALLLETVSRSSFPTPPTLEEALLALLCRQAPATLRSRHAALAGLPAAGGSSGMLLACPARLALLVPPPPWPAQRLVDVLKHPLCVGTPRRLVLDQLGRHYGRSFGDHWDFVRFAEERKLGLDLTSPPHLARPASGQSGKRRFATDARMGQ